MEGQGTPDQSQAGPGEPPRDTTLRTSVHTQLADGEQGTPYNTYSPFRAWVDLEAGAAAAQSAGSARSATGAAANAASICNGPSERIVQHADGSAVPIAYSDKTVPWRSVRRSR